MPEKNIKMIQPQPTIQAKDRRLKNFNEVSLGYSKRIATEEARRCPQCAQPACRQGCPLDIDIPLFIRLIREGHYKAAHDKIQEQNPWPGICGRVCAAPCEKACILNQEGDPIGIRSLERFAYDHGRRKPLFSQQPASPKEKRIAVIGSGIAGLTAAWELSSYYSVVVYEALPYVGGVLSYGISEFRLPKKIVEEGIGDLKERDIAFKTNYLLGSILKVEDILARNFEAVVLSPGRGGVLHCDMPGIFAPDVLFAEEILVAANLWDKDVLLREVNRKVKANVVILGSDYGAMDVARILRRLGKNVAVVFPATEEDLNISAQERDQALQEGVVLHPLTKPIKILTNENNDVVGVTCMNMDFADAGGHGGWEILPVPDSDFTLDAETVIVSQGKRDPLSYKRMIPNLRLEQDGSIWMDQETGMTSMKNVFACGQSVDMLMTLPDAIADGKRVARGVVQYLQERRKDA